MNFLVLLLGGTSFSKHHKHSTTEKPLVAPLDAERTDKVDCSERFRVSTCDMRGEDKAQLSVALGNDGPIGGSEQPVTCENLYTCQGGDVPTPCYSAHMSLHGSCALAEPRVGHGNDICDPAKTADCIQKDLYRLSKLGKRPSDALPKKTNEVVRQWHLDTYNGDGEQTGEKKVSRQYCRDDATPPCTVQTWMYARIGARAKSGLCKDGPCGSAEYHTCKPQIRLATQDLCEFGNWQGCEGDTLACP